MKKTKPSMPKLPKTFTDNLAAIAAGLHGKPIESNFAREWKISDKNAKDLLQYMHDTGMIAMKWLPERGALCFIKKELPN
jgi:MarR-like DNA-binding transcriptional regulator SgrR of sgrS sRNA